MRPGRGAVMKELHTLVLKADRLYDGQVEFVLDEGVFDRQLGDDAETAKAKTKAKVKESQLDIFFFITPNGGLYRGARIKFCMYLDLNTYPSDSPHITCLNDIYHPNIYMPAGTRKSSVCVRSDWELGSGLEGSVMSMLFLFYHPEPGDPLGPWWTFHPDHDDYPENVRRSLRGQEVKGCIYDKLLGNEEQNDEEGFGYEDNNIMDIAEEEGAGEMPVLTAAKSATSISTTEDAIDAELTTSAVVYFLTDGNVIDSPLSLTLIPQSHHTNTFRSHLKAKRTNVRSGRMTKRKCLTQIRREGIPWTLRKRRKIEYRTGIPY